MKIIDLSVPLESSPSEPQNVDVIHDAHDKGVAGMTALFDCEADDLPDGLGWAVDTLTLSTHAGTHVDAPWHYAPVAEGKNPERLMKCPWSGSMVMGWLSMSGINRGAVSWESMILRMGSRRSTPG